MIGKKTSLREHPVFLAPCTFAHETTAEKKNRLPSHSKNTSYLIEPRVYELGAIQT